METAYRINPDLLHSKEFPSHLRLKSKRDYIKAKNLENLIKSGERYNILYFIRREYYAQPLTFFSMLEGPFEQEQNPEDFKNKQVLSDYYFERFKKIGHFTNIQENEISQVIHFVPSDKAEKLNLKYDFRPIFYLEYSTKEPRLMFDLDKNIKKNLKNKNIIEIGRETYFKIKDEAHELKESGSSRAINGPGYLLTAKLSKWMVEYDYSDGVPSNQLKILGNTDGNESMDEILDKLNFNLKGIVRYPSHWKEVMEPIYFFKGFKIGELPIKFVEEKSVEIYGPSEIKKMLELHKDDIIL